MVVVCFITVEVQESLCGSLSYIVGPVRAGKPTWRRRFESASVSRLKF